VTGYQITVVYYIIK